MNYVSIYKEKEGIEKFLVTKTLRFAKEVHVKSLSGLLLISLAIISTCPIIRL